ncbi:MAG: rhomboid family intramembrane serine protease [Micropepsaceae bacterium]
MFPLGSASRRILSFPFMTVLVILLNAGAFYLELTQGNAFVAQWSAVPADIMQGRHLETLLTSMFLHGGWMHIIGNMVFLWAFAPPIEEGMGSGRFILFYLLGGIAAMATQMWVAPDSTVPALGASGAVAAVMGAYLVTYPRDQIRTLVLAPLFRVISIPAILLIGVWIATQVISVTTEMPAGESGGVAYFAHIGGAVFGAVTGLLFRRHLGVQPTSAG